MEMILRAKASEPNGKLEYVLSDDSVDRHGTVIEPSGWQLQAFKKNPIALFNHDRDFIIGHWTNTRVENNQLVSQLKLLKEGISARLDEIRAAVDAGVLRAVSVGFMPLEGGVKLVEDVVHYVKQELLEASLVSVASNKNALQKARSVGTSPEGMSLLFGVLADLERGTDNRGNRGEQAASSQTRKPSVMTPLSKRIEDANAELVALRDQLTTLITTAGERDMDETEQATADELNLKIEEKQKSVAALKRSEANLAASSEIVVVGGEGARAVNPQGDGAALPARRPFAVPAQKLAPKDYIWRSLVVQLKTHCDSNKRTPLEILKETYGEDEATRAVLAVITRTATVPADTVTSGWASQLVNTAIGDFFDALMPNSIYPGLSAKGGRFTFGRNGILSLPTRATTPTIAGSFVGQGSPIPVRQGAFSAVSMTPKKMGVISTFTREIAEHSTPAIEALIRQAIIEDTSVAIDSILLDATAASTTRPAGLRNGVAAITATAGGGFAALVADIKALAGALITATAGNIRNPVWIMNPVNALSISLTQNAGGDFPFKQEIASGQLQGYPLIVSSNVTAGMVLLVDAADFATVTGDTPRFDVSDQAVLHMEDTTPLALSTTGSPNTVAAPARSLWQTDTLGIRMLLDINWILRRTGVVVWTQTVTW